MAKFRKKPVVIEAFRLNERGLIAAFRWVLFARCKAHNYLIDGRHTGWCPTENDFCSYGKRKEGVD